MITRGRSSTDLLSPSVSKITAIKAAGEKSCLGNLFIERAKQSSRFRLIATPLSCVDFALRPCLSLLVIPRYTHPFPQLHFRSVCRSITAVVISSGGCPTLCYLNSSPIQPSPPTLTSSYRSSATALETPSRNVYRCQRCSSTSLGSIYTTMST